MISFPALGSKGRLGNQLFQMAATIALALDHGEPFGFPRWQYQGAFPLSGCFHQAIPPGPLYTEPCFAFRPIPYQTGMHLHGHFQSERHFQPHADQVRRLLTPLLLPRQEDYGDAASVHVRRTDYVGNPHYAQLTEKYYRQAMATLRRDRGVRRFLLISDDPAWCVRAFADLDDVEVVEPMDEVRHLALMCASGHHVIANSTFSWWGAWLSTRPDKTVIAPRDWFGPGWPYDRHDRNDLCPSQWIRLADEP